MKCKDCGYYYKDEDDDFACCHFTGPVGWAPCEDEEDEVEDYEEEAEYE
jgi:hypothetical protein